MSPERLLQHFTRISEAPDAIPRLRNFVLDLAVRGKLVEQDPNDEPATALLCKLLEAKDRLQEEENIRGRQPVPRTESSELGFVIPNSWELPAFDDVFVIVSGVTKGRNLAGRKTIELPYLRVANVQRGYLDLSAMKTISIPEDELPRYALRHGDVLMTEGGDWDKLGRAAIWLGEIAQCIHQNHVFRVRSPLPEKLHPRWVVTYTNSLLGRIYFENASKQTTNLASINMTQLRGCPLPLPPLAEQHRIVAKVDELMALCDQFEAVKTEREQSRDRLVTASLHRLNSPTDTVATDAPDLPAQQADAFRDHARFVFDHLPLLTTRPEHIKQLRQTILNLAVRGKLVRQDSNDEPAAELLKRIQEEKAQLVKEGKISRDNLRILAGDNELSFELKPGWQAARISQILVELQTGPFGSSLHQSDYQKGGIPVINPASIKNERLIPIDGMAVGPATLERLATFKLRTGDIVMGRRGEMGRCAVVTEHESGWLCGTGSLILRLPECVFPRFFVTLIGSPFVREYLGGSAVGATMQNLNQSILLNLVIGLPPLAEQHRIIARVDELMALCDQLEAQLTVTEADSRRLLEAVLHEALNSFAEVTEQLESVTARTNALQN